MRYKNKTTGAIVKPSCALAAQSFERSKEWVAIADAPAPKSKADTPPKTLDKMTTAELTALAAERGVDISECKNNAERAAKINEAASQADNQ